MQPTTPKVASRAAGLERPALDEAKLSAALEKANLPSIVMVLFQLTGDRAWLEEPYLPSRTRGLDEDPTGGFPADVQREIRREAARAIMAWSRGAEPAHDRPGGKTLAEMMTACMGETVPAEYEFLMYSEQASEVGDEHPDLPGDYSAIIIGAGISGLVAARQLVGRGIRCTVLEKQDDVGGVWSNHRYPGCGVDTPSYLYSLSFFPHDWSTHFGKRDEVHSYLRRMAEELALTDRVELGATVTTATWLESEQLWQVDWVDANGTAQTRRSNVVVSATGLFSVPVIPTLPEGNRFTGTQFHAAEWPDGLDVAGKRVAIIGTGATSMQIVPAIADRVAELNVFQRSPQWVAPSNDYFKPVGDDHHWLMEHVPYYHRWYKFRLAWIFNDRVHPALQVDPDWPELDRSINAANDGHRRYYTRYLEKELDGRPDLLKKCLPAYPPFGKRMLLDNGWFAALRNPSVSLVTDAVTGLSENGVLCTDGGHYDADIVVFATGYDVHHMANTYSTVGRDSMVLADVWQDNPTAYLGMTTPGFPNMFFMYGPNTNPGAGGSYIFMAECQGNYIGELVEHMAREGIESVEVAGDVHDEYNARVDEAHARMIWTHPGVQTYYRNTHGRVSTNSPWRVADYWHLTRTPNLADFEVRVGARTP